MSDKICVTNVRTNIYESWNFRCKKFCAAISMSPICLETSLKKKKWNHVEYLFEILKLKGLMQIPSFKNCIDMNDFRRMTSQFAMCVCTSQTQHELSLLHSQVPYSKCSATCLSVEGAAVASVSPRRSGLDARPIHVGFMVGKVAVWPVSSPRSSVSPVSILPQLFLLTEIT